MSEFLLEMCCVLHRCKSTCFQSCLRTFNEIRVFERVRNALVDILENGAGNQLLTAITLKGFKVINPYILQTKGNWLHWTIIISRMRSQRSTSCALVASMPTTILNAGIVHHSPLAWAREKNWCQLEILCRMLAFHMTRTIEIGSSLWATSICEASGLAKIVMPGFLREKDQLIGESDLVWSYILRAWRTLLEVVNSPIVNCRDAY